MAHKVFAYGTLTVPEVMETVTDQSFRHDGCVLSGYVRFLIHQQVYPGIVPAESNQTPGRIYFGVDDKALKRLDYFEGDLYVRQTVEVKTSAGVMHQALAYVLADAHHHLLSTCPWDEAVFAEQHLAGFLSRARGWMREYQQQL